MELFAKIIDASIFQFLNCFWEAIVRVKSWKYETCGVKRYRFFQLCYLYLCCFFYIDTSDLFVFNFPNFIRLFIFVTTEAFCHAKNVTCFFTCHYDCKDLSKILKMFGQTVNANSFLYIMEVKGCRKNFGRFHKCRQDNR